MLDHDRELRDRSNEAGELIGEVVGRTARARYRDVQPLGGPPDRERITARRAGRLAEADTDGALRDQRLEHLDSVRPRDVDDHHRREPTRVSLHALGLVGVVWLGRVLNENRPLHSMAIQLEEEALDGFEPIGRDVAVAVDNPHAMPSRGASVHTPGAIGP
jgi:hypothetical protein